MTLPIVVLLMLLIASAVAMATLRLRIPYTVALVITGLALSIIRNQFYPEVDVGIHLTKELLFVVLLPVLIYEAAFHLERQRAIGVIPEAIYQVFSQEHKQERQKLKNAQEHARDMIEHVRQEEIHALRRKLLLIRKESLRQASVDGAIDTHVMRHLVGELDEKLHQLDLAHYLHQETSD